MPRISHITLHSGFALAKRPYRKDTQWACELLLAEVDVGEFSKQVGLALFYDGKLDLAAMYHDR
jgi:hypothetical protein